ncbi:hypothetical protein SK128_010743, partial [Halocaridina rubra]
GALSLPTRDTSSPHAAPPHCGGPLNPSESPPCGGSIIPPATTTSTTTTTTTTTTSTTTSLISHLIVGRLNRRSRHVVLTSPAPP